MMHRKKWYWLNTASWYARCTLNNSNYRQIFPVHLLTQRLSPGDAAREQHCSPTAHAAVDDPGKHLGRSTAVPSWDPLWAGMGSPSQHGARQPTTLIGGNGHSSGGHHLPDTILHWRGWLGGCFALYNAIRKITFWRTSSGLGPSFPAYWPKLSSASTSYLMRTWWSNRRRGWICPEHSNSPHKITAGLFWKPLETEARLVVSGKILSHPFFLLLQNKEEKFFPVETTGDIHVGNSCFQRTATG